jgi:hypothetical protein
MAVAALTQRLNVFQCRIGRRHMLAAHPARYLAMQLAGHSLVDFVSGEAKFAHVFVCLK